MYFSKVIFTLWILLLLCVTLGETRGTQHGFLKHKQQQSKVIAKRGVVENILTAGDGPVCSYIIQFTYTMAKYKLSKLTEYLVKNLPTMITKRDVGDGDGYDYILNEQTLLKFEMDLQAMTKRVVDNNNGDEDAVYGGGESLSKKALLRSTMMDIKQDVDNIEDDNHPENNQVPQNDDLFTSLVTGSRGLSCKLIVQYLKYYATSSFQELLKYVTENLTNIIG